ncbi:GRAM domain-containing protein 4-like [Physella acuta]|uniref:GRAM domain-containing protein 4-like n=1 Tax=Physella acuta TaxID=109671 RepID=UPI0027DBA61C|nr:GRAM domain-containing protein 4-like [Physella acuta]
MTTSLKTLRQRFNKDRDDSRKDGKDSPKGGQSLNAAAEEENFELVDTGDDPRQFLSIEKSKASSEDAQSCGSFPSEDLMSSITWNSPEEKKIFEEQLNLIQEQLMMVMIENQTLKSELHSSKNQMELERVKTELAYEQRRCEVLEKKLENFCKKKAQKVNRTQSELPPRNRITLSGAGISDNSVAEDNVDGASTEIQLPARKKRLHERARDYFISSFYSFLDDFTEEPPDNNDVDPDGDPLTVKTLKENIKRFGTEAKPYINTIQGIGDLLAWKSPPYTLIVFVVYMYSVWQGWFFPVLLFCLTLRLFINFLRHRGWNLNFNFFDTIEEVKDTEEKDLGVSDKFNLVMQVARKVQNFLGQVADSLEKIKSLLTWRHPEASRQLLLAFSAAFITSCILPTNYLFFYAGLATGVKLFIIDYIYNRFPKVRRKYDSSYRLWQELPTDIQFEKKYVKSEIDKYILPYDEEKREVAAETKSDQVSMDDRSFCELFSLPESECPLSGWHGGRRCTLINKEKSLTAAFKNGRLYLTHSFLCFERTKVPSPKNIVIPLADIARLEKAKPYAWMPGGGMAIEVAVAGNDKTFVFGGLLNRDELFDHICEAGYRKIKEVKTDDKLLPWMQRKTPTKKHVVPKHYQPFTLAHTYEA